MFDLWVEAWRNKNARGDVIVIRYADDFVLGFEQRADAERFLGQLRERLAKFGLELHAEKTRLIEFGRFAASNRKERGKGKPETFDFLGFTHICGKNRKTGYFEVRRKTVGKRLAKKLRDIKQHLRRRMHEPPAETGEWLRSVVQGYFNYHAIPGNRRSLVHFSEQRGATLAASIRSPESEGQAALGAHDTTGPLLSTHRPCGASFSECSI